MDDHGTGDGPDAQWVLSNSAGLRIALAAALAVLGLLLGGFLVAAKDLGRSSAPIEHCNPTTTKADWLTDHESDCFQRLAPDR